MFCGGLGNILAKNYASNMNILYLTGSQMFLGALSLLLVGASRVGLMPFSYDSTSILILFYLAFLSASGFILWNNVMKYNHVGQVSIYLFLIPVFGVFLSTLILGEVLQLVGLFALLLVVAGIVIVNNKPNVKQVFEHEKV